MLWIICVFCVFSRLFFAALWTPAGKELALVGDVYCIFVTFPCGILEQMWYLIVSFPDLCRLSYCFTKFMILIVLLSSLAI